MRAMSQRQAGSGGPLRKELPCVFSVSRNARSSALKQAGVCILVSVILLGIGAGQAGASVWVALVVGLFGIAFALGGWLLMVSAFTFVTMDDTGLLVRSMGRARRIAWDDMDEVVFSTTRKTEYAGGIGLRSGLVTRAVAQYMDDEREQDPFHVGRVRQQYEPSAIVSGAAGSGRASFSDTLGWGFFTALYAEAEARGIRITRVS